MPFDGSNFKRLVKQITQGDYYEPPKKLSRKFLNKRISVIVREYRTVLLSMIFFFSEFVDGVQVTDY